MTPVRLLLTAALALGASGCLLNTETDNSFIADYQFGEGQTVSGWSAGAVEYPSNQEATVAFVGDVRQRPEETLDLLPALYLRANNVSGDMFMYWYRKVTGFLPNTSYTVGFDVAYISNFGRDCTSGAGVTTWIKAGAVNVEPARSLDQGGTYQLNIDKGEQATSGATILTLGDLRNNAVGCIQNGPYAIWGRHSGSDAVTVTANASGELWLIMGIESGFTGPVDVYITRLGVRFRPVE